MKRLDLPTMLMAVALLAAGMLIGPLANSGNEAHGQVRSGPQPPVLQSGGQLSVPVLKEISATLQQIDARLARLEIIAQRMPVTAMGVPRTNDQ
jgi:hypothetical protein